MPSEQDGRRTSHESIDHMEMVIHGMLVLAIAVSGLVGGRAFVSHFAEQFGLTGAGGLAVMALIGVVGIAIMYAIGRFGRWLDAK